MTGRARGLAGHPHAEVRPAWRWPLYLVDGLIHAPLLAVNFADDELNPVELGGLERAIAQVRRGRGITLPVGPNSRGHQTLAVAEVWQDWGRQHLHQTEKRQATSR